MNKEKTFEDLLKEDIKKLTKYIKEKKIKIHYSKKLMESIKDPNGWFIDNEPIYDFLSYRMDLNLHWTKSYTKLIHTCLKDDEIEIIGD